MKILNAVASGALVLAGIGVSLPAMANTAANASTRIYSSILGETVTGASGQAVQASSFQSGSGVGPAVGQTLGKASATEGTLKASASTSGSTQPFGYNNSINVSGYGRASWNDYLVIGAGNGMLGQQGHITAELNLSGMRVFNTGPNSTNLDEVTTYESLSIIGTGMSGNCGGWNYCATEQFNTAGGSFSNWNLPSVITVNIAMTFGSLTGLGYTLDLMASTAAFTRAGLGQGTWADSAIDYTLAWGGITGVFDKNGNAVSNFTATSTSGFDYLRQVAAPVPEPETYTMMLAGLGLLGLMTRRRKQKLNA